MTTSRRKNRPATSASRARTVALAATAAVSMLALRSAAAECPDNLVRSAFSARLDAEYASALIDTLLVGGSLTFPVPTEPFTLDECPSFLEDTVATPTGGDIALTPVSGDVAFFEGGLEFWVVLDVATEFDMALQVCALPDTACQASMSGEALEVRGRFRLAGSGCNTEIVIESFEIFENPASTDLELTGCGIVYDWVGEALFSWFEDSILDSVREELTLQVNDSASEWLSTGLERLATEGVEGVGLRILASPESLAVDEQALHLSFAMGVEPLLTAPPQCELRPRSDLPTDTPAPLVPPAAGGAGIAISKAAIQNVVTSAWAAGWLCLDSRDLGVELGADLEELAPNLDVALLVDMPVTPSVSLSSDGAAIIASLDIPVLRVGVSTTLPDEAPSLVTVTSGAQLTTEILPDPSDNSFRLSPREIVAYGFELESRAGPLVLDPEGLAQTIDLLVLPELRDALEDLTLSGAFFSGNNLATEIVGLSVNERGIGAGLEIYLASPDDRTAPQTRLERAPPPFVPASFVVDMDSVDETPPERQVRHRLYVDGVPDDRLRVGRSIAVNDLSSGPHRIGLAAVDLAGNEDPNPVELTVTVDTTRPTLELVSPPRGVLRAAQTEIRYAVDDDWTPAESLRIDYVVGEVARTAQPDLRVAAGTLPAGEPLVLTSLREDQAYRVTLTVTDRAGNRSEEELAFAVDADPTFDCSSIPAPPWMLVLIAAFAIRARCRRAKSAA